MMIVAETVAHVDERYIVGLADGKSEIFSLLFDFYKYLEISDNNYEKNWIMFDVSIYHLKEKDNEYIQEILEKYGEEIETWREDILSNKKIENFYGNLLLLPIKTDSSDSPDKNFINMEDQTKLQEIVENSVKIF